MSDDESPNAAWTIASTMSSSTRVFEMLSTKYQVGAEQILLGLLVSHVLPGNLLPVPDPSQKMSGSLKWSVLFCTRLFIGAVLPGPWPPMTTPPENAVSPFGTLRVMVLARRF